MIRAWLIARQIKPLLTVLCLAYRASLLKGAEIARGVSVVGSVLL